MLYGYTIILVGLIGLAIRFKPHDTLFPIMTTNVLKGICVAIIIASHVVLRLPDAKLLNLYQVITYQAVAIFFMLSGYGLMRSLLNKPGYLTNFLQDKISRIYLAILTLNIVAWLTYRLILQINWPLSSIVIDTLLIRTIGNINFMWFFVVLIGFYLLFYLTMRFLGPKLGLWLLTSLIVLYIMITWYLKVPDYWYNSSIGLIIGLWLGHYATGWLRNADVKIIWWSTIGGFSYLGLMVLIIKHFPGLMLWKITAAGIVCLMIAMLDRWWVLNNRILSQVGLMSLEAYLIHRLILDLVVITVPFTDNVIQVVYLGITIISTIFFHFGFKSLMKLISKNTTKRINI